jgi:hypothetical protein
MTRWAAYRGNADSVRNSPCLSWVMTDAPGWISVALGFGLGMKHALEPDHLVAVSTLMCGESRRGRVSGRVSGRMLRLGALWGAGHLSTVALGVGLLIAMRVTIAADHLLLFETPVAAMLIGLGAWTIVGALTSAGHHHGSGAHHRSLAPMRLSRPAWWSYAVGSVHGMAGTGALVIFVGATYPDLSSAITYVLLFGVGAMLGMAVLTCTLAVPLRALQGRPQMYRLVTASAGGLSVYLGVTIALELARQRL